MRTGASAEGKSRARQSILNGLAHSGPPSPIPGRPRFGLAGARAALIIVASLGLTTGVAAASHLDLHLVADDVFDTVVERLRVPIRTQLDSVRLEPRDGLASDSSEGPAESPSSQIADEGVARRR